MPHTTDEPWTAARWRELPPREGEKYEVIEGELVVTGIPRRRHALGVEQLATPVAEFVHRLGIGEIHRYVAPVFLNEYNVYLPDLVVYRAGAARTVEWEDLGTPMLAVEVLSHSTAKHDRGGQAAALSRRRSGRILDRGSGRAPDRALAAPRPKARDTARPADLAASWRRRAVDPGSARVLCAGRGGLIPTPAASG